MTRLDLNENKLVDEQDYNLLLNYNLGTGTLNSQGKWKEQLSNLSTANRTYLKYYTGNPVTSYDTYVLNVQNISTASNYEMNAQTRNTFHPETEQSIVSLGDGSNIWGTGFIVGEHTIATAAHCVCNITSSTSINFLDNMKVRIYSADASTLNATFDVDVIHVPKAHMDNYDNSHNEQGIPNKYFATYDYALIEVSEDLSQYGIMQLGCMTNDFIADGNTVALSGFTNPEGNSGYYYWSRFYTNGNTVSDSESQWRFMVDVCAHGGQSGGPIYYQESGNSPKIVVGINSCMDRYNTLSPKINPSLRRFYLSNNNLDY